jgi:ribonuclease P protein component
VVPGTFDTLKRRSEFLRVAAGRRSAAETGVVVQAAVRPRGAASGSGIRVGFTASRKVGNAVVRNRAKRRLRAAAAIILPIRASPGTDYVLIARAGTAARPFAELLADLQSALRRIERRHRSPTEPAELREQLSASQETPSEPH